MGNYNMDSVLNIERKTYLKNCYAFYTLKFAPLLSKQANQDYVKNLENEDPSKDDTQNLTKLISPTDLKSQDAQLKDDLPDLISEVENTQNLTKLISPTDLESQDAQLNDDLPDLISEAENQDTSVVVDSELISERANLENEEAQLKVDPITSEEYKKKKLNSERGNFENQKAQLKDANIQNKDVDLKTVTKRTRLDSKLNNETGTNYSTKDLSTIMQAKLGSCQWIGQKAVIHQVEYTDTEQIKNISKVPLSTAVNINNAFFEGKLYVRLKNHGKDQGYFNGKKRINSWAVQGRFKKRLRFDHVWGGQKYDHQWTNLPPKFIMKSGLKFAKSLNPSLHESLFDSQPFAIWPLITQPTVLNISLPGQEPDIKSHRIKENTKLLTDSKKRPVLKSADHRKDFFANNPAALKKYYFETDKVYTFETYQNLFDLLNFTYLLPIKNVSLLNKLQEMPIEFSAFLFQPKDVSNRNATTEQFRDRKIKDLKFCWRTLLHSKHGYLQNKKDQISKRK